MTTKEYHIPRRLRIDRMTLAEVAIRNAAIAVQDMGTDVRLTEAFDLSGTRGKAMTTEEQRRYPLFFRELAHIIGVHEEAPLIEYMRAVHELNTRLTAAEARATEAEERAEENGNRAREWTRACEETAVRWHEDKEELQQQLATLTAQVREVYRILQEATDKARPRDLKQIPDAWHELSFAVGRALARLKKQEKSCTTSADVGEEKK